MKSSVHAFAALIAVALAATLPAAAQSGVVSVSVDGAPVALSPAPISRAGRIFVPLRGVFDKLGASVVYANRTINATGNDRAIALHVGSTTATVNGAAQVLDVAPFIVGATTYVPLRFVSQALGDRVNYDGANRIVAISTARAAGMPLAAAPSSATARPSAAPSAVKLTKLQPSAGDVVAAKQPTISADFSQIVDPNSLKIVLDGLDVTAVATRSESGIVYAPPSPLQAAEHVVKVAGKDAAGSAFSKSWKFTSGTEQAKNFVQVLSPGSADAVASTFTLSGKTLPNARIHIVAGGTGSIGGIIAYQSGSYAGDTTADGAGNFSQQVSLNVGSGGSIGVTVTSTDPVSKGSAEQKLRLQVK